MLKAQAVNRTAVKGRPRALTARAGRLSLGMESVKKGAAAAAEGLALVMPNFSGAVDIVVVVQPDGSMKSSKWTGVRKSREYARRS